MSLRLILSVLFSCVWLCQLAQAGESANTPDSSPYLLLEGDVLQISVWKEDGMEREIMIAPDGNISFPLVGLIRAKGLTVAGLQNVLTARIGSFIPEPSVTVVLKGAAGSKYYVIGKVNRPGDFPLLTPVSVLQALSMAGGISTFADYNSIKIIRKENGTDQALEFRYGDIEEGEKLTQNILLHSGDVVVVP